MSVQHLKKMHKMCKGLSVDQAVEEIKGPAKVNEVIPKVDAEDRAQVFNKLRMEKATELQKQAMPAGGSMPGMEPNPALVQTSSQTAMAKTEDMEKSAEQTKNPALPKKPKEGAVAGEIPESDVIGDYSERMGEEKSVNDKPVKKQGFGSAEALKKAHSLLKKKYK